MISPTDLKLLLKGLKSNQEWEVLLTLTIHKAASILELLEIALILELLGIALILMRVVRVSIQQIQKKMQWEKAQWDSFNRA